jgi:Ca2+/Na+ antiporter
MRRNKEVDLLLKIILVWFLSYVFIFARGLYKKITTSKDELKKEIEITKQKENDCIVVFGQRKYNILKFVILCFSPLVACHIIVSDFRKIVGGN